MTFPSFPPTGREVIGRPSWSAIILLALTFGVPLIALTIRVAF